MKTLKISVVMPAFNSEKTIRRAIDSILNQTFEDFELIVVNDNSTDGTKDIVKKYIKRNKNVRLINNKTQMGVSGSLNKGFKYSNAQLIARMDADDYSDPRRLELQYETLNKNPKVAVVGADMKIVNEQGKLIFTRKYPTKSKDLKKVMFRYSPFAHPVVLMKKDVFEKCGGYDMDLKLCEDVDLWFRIGKDYDFASIPKYLLIYSQTMSSNTNKKLKNQEIMNLRIRLKAIFDYGYKPSLCDIFYNFIQAATLWFMPPKIRIWTYNFLRSNKII